MLGDFMDCPPASFDLITSIATLHHMPADSARTRMRELRKAGGTLAIIGLARNGSRCVGWVFRREGCGAFHEVPQFGTEAGGGGPVHDVVVDGDGEV
jgi:hypothetical protein